MCPFLRVSAVPALVGLILVLPLRSAVTSDAQGWTVITPSADSRIVYVSNSEGSDANDGLSASSPKKTITAGNALLRDGYPDHLLLKRGDVFPAEPDLGHNALLSYWKSGRGAGEPMVFSAYGSPGPRPVVKMVNGIINHNGTTRDYEAIIGIDFYRSVSDPTSPDYDGTGVKAGLRMVGGGSHLRVEDCRFRYMEVVIQSYGKGNQYTNLSFRRNVVSYAWINDTLTVDSRVQGMYLSGVHNYLIEENVLHHNGWSELVPNAGANLYNHNLYIQSDCDGTQVVRGNIVSYGAAHGVQLRSGGTAEMNAFVGNAVGMNLGYYAVPDIYTGVTIARENVITDGRPQLPDQVVYPQTGAIWGMWKQSIENATVDDNIVANVRDDRGSVVVPYRDMTANEFGTGNIAWGWHQNNEPTSDPGWLDPDRDADSFALSAGYLDWNDYVEAAMNRPHGQMPYDLTAYAYVDYIRAGFDKTAVTPPYPLDPECSGDAVTAVSVYPISIVGDLPGDILLLSASLVPSDACNRGMVWSTNNALVATVDAHGVVTTTGIGTATITVTTNDGGHTDTVPVTVTGAIDVTGVSVDTTAFSLEAGDFVPVAWTASPSNATDPSILWSSSNPSVATVDADGVVEAIGVGVVTITATTVEGAFTDTVEVTVTASAWTDLLSFNRFVPSAVAVEDISGGEYVLGSGSTDLWVARVGLDYCSVCSTLVEESNGVYYLDSGSGGSPGTFQVVTWPEESGAFTVRFNYRLTSQGLPTVRIRGGLVGDVISKWHSTPNDTVVLAESVLSDAVSTWQSGSLSTTLSGTYDYLVVELYAGQFNAVSSVFASGSVIAVTDVSLDRSNLILKTGAAASLIATVMPDNATDPSVVWSSSDTAVAIVDGSGLVTAVGAGAANITVTTRDGALVDLCAVTVSDAASVSSNELIGYGDFSGAALLDMSGNYVVGNGVKAIWLARVGTGGQLSQIVEDGDGYDYLEAGYGNSPGAFQVLEWPSGREIKVVVNFRKNSSSLPFVNIFGANSGDTIEKYSGSNTLSLIHSETLTDGASWSRASFVVSLETTYDYLVVRLRDGDFDDVSIISSPFIIPAVLEICPLSSDALSITVRALETLQVDLESSLDFSAWSVISALDLSRGESSEKVVDVPSRGDPIFIRLAVP